MSLRSNKISDFFSRRKDYLFKSCPTKRGVDRINAKHDLKTRMLGYIEINMIRSNRLKTKLLSFFKNDYFVLFILYFLAWGVMLFNVGGLNGDGYTYTYGNDSWLRGTFFYHGLVYGYYEWRFLKTLGEYLFGNPVFFMRLLTFSCLYLVACVYYLLLREIKTFKVKHAFYITTIFMVYPLFQARESVMFLLYALYLLSFMLGCYAYYRSLQYSKV